MDWTQFTTLSKPQMNAIWHFDCKDPFSFLGIHPLEPDKGIKTAIRTYQPHAAFVQGESLDSKEEFDFVKVGDTGFFEAVLDIEFDRFLYKLHIKLPDGTHYSVVDPYAFSPVISEYDQYLISVGNHYELYRKMGANVIEHQDVIGVHFAVWAPNARAVAVVGDFNKIGRAHV